MPSTIAHYPDVNDLVVRLNAAVGGASEFSSNDRDKLLEATNALRRALEDPVHQLMTIAKWPVGHGVLRVALQIGLFEHFDEEEKSLEQLEISCGVERNLLVRIMRVLVCMGLFEEGGAGHYTQNTLSKSLQDATTLAMIRGMADTTDVMPKLPDYLAGLGFQNPDDRRKSLFGYAKETTLNMYEWLQTNPERLDIFHKYHEANAILNENNLHGNLNYLLGSDSRPFPTVQHAEGTEKVILVDIGGGHGQSLKAFRRHMPALKGRMILQDLLCVVEGQRNEEGIEIMPYDFFTPQPVKGACIYFLRFVLHNWPESACREILWNTITAMDPQNSRLVVNDFLLPDTNAGTFEVFNDIQMMMFAGMERTESQWRHLLTSVGLEVQCIRYPNPGAKTPECLIEAVVGRKWSHL